MGRSLADARARARGRRHREGVDSEGGRQRTRHRAIPPRPGQHAPLHGRLSGSSRRAAGPAAGDHDRHHRLDRRRAQGRRAKPSRRAPRGRSAGVRGLPARPLLPGPRRARAGADAVRASEPQSPPIGRPPASAWPTTTRRFLSTPTCRRRRCCPRPGRRWSRPSSSTRRWRKRTRPTPTSGPTTSGTGGPPSRSSGAPSSCGPTTPTRTSPTAAFSRHAAGSTRPSRSSAGPWSWTRCRFRCWRTAPCSTTSRAATARRTDGYGRSSRATPPT